MRKCQFYCVAEKYNPISQQYNFKCKSLENNDTVTEEKLRKMTSSSNLRLGSVWTDELFEMINQQFKVLGRQYQVLPNVGICCRELRRLKVTYFAHAFAISTLSDAVGSRI